MKLKGLFAGCALLSCVLPALGQSTNEDIKLRASDASSFDNFGISVGISGDIGIVGMPGDDDSGNGSGSAYMYEVSTGQQLFKLRASDGVNGDSFGVSVAISGTRAIVGANYNSDAGTGSGSAYIFDTTTGQELIKLTASDAFSFDQFGTSVAISGSIAIVGAFGDDDFGSLSGSAYVFDAITGQQLFKLTASDASAGDFFGRSVAVSGTLGIVGALGGGDAGCAYIFDIASGQQLFKITASDAAEGDIFGSSVAISGNLAVVGASQDDDGGTNSGSAYIFDATTGQQLFKLTATNAVMNDSFGTSVAVSGGIAVVGATSGDGLSVNTGTAYVFDVNNGQQILQLHASDGAMGDRFGNSVTISGNRLMAGSPSSGEGDEEVSGSAYVYNLGPAVDQQPQSTIVTAGETATFSVTLNNDTEAVYQWRRDGVPLQDGNKADGSKTSTVFIFTSEDDDGLYDCVVTNQYGTVTSDTALLAVRSDPDACVVDLNDDGELDFFDVSAFLTQFGIGCP